MKFPIEWLEMIFEPDYNRQRIADVLDLNLDEAALSGEPMLLKFCLPWQCHEWVREMAILHKTTAPDIVEICVQSGRYVQQIYPRAADPLTPYMQAILNADRLCARAERAQGLVNQFFCLNRAFISRIVSTHKLPPAGHVSTSTAVSVPISKAEKVPSQMSIPKTFTFETQQHIAGDLIHYLFSNAVKRRTTPNALLVHCVVTAHYLDLNFPDQGLPTFREELIVKIMQAEKLGLELSQILSALETYLTDWPRVMESYAMRFDPQSEKANANC